MSDNKKLVYRHRRNDTNKVFYVGMGTLKRAKDKYGRSNYWKSIVDKAGYTVEIVAEDLTKENAIDLEVFMISEYGLDNLCNHTTGGECYFHSEETKRKMSISRKGFKMSNKAKSKLSKTTKGKPRSGNPYNWKHTDATKNKMSKSSYRKRKVINTSTNEIYSSVKDAHKQNNIKMSYSHFKRLVREGSAAERFNLKYYYE